MIFSNIRVTCRVLILPGGESTTMGKLLRDQNMLLPLRSHSTDLPVFGTCAGLILLAKATSQEESHLGTMDIVVERNAYGRQLGSFYTEAECKGSWSDSNDFYPWTDYQQCWRGCRSFSNS